MCFASFFSKFSGRSGSVRGPFGIRSASVRGPFGIRSGSVRVRLGQFRTKIFGAKNFKISKNFNLCGRRCRGGGKGDIQDYFVVLLWRRFQDGEDLDQRICHLDVWAGHLEVWWVAIFKILKFFKI